MFESKQSSVLSDADTVMEIKRPMAPAITTISYPYTVSLPERENKQLWVGDTVELVSPETLNGEQWVHRYFTIIDIERRGNYLIETNLTEGDKAQVANRHVLWLTRNHLRLVYRGPGSVETSGRWFYRCDDGADHQIHIFPLPRDNTLLSIWELRAMMYYATLDRSGNLSENDEIDEQSGGTRRDPSSFTDGESRRMSYHTNIDTSRQRRYADTEVYETARVYENRFVNTPGYPRIHERHRHVYRRDESIPDLNRRPFTDDSTTGAVLIPRPTSYNVPTSSTLPMHARIGLTENQVTDSNLVIE